MFVYGKTGYIIYMLISIIFPIAGRLKRYQCEVKCLCNLAFAQSQLEDYTLSSTTFSEALDKARTIEDAYLQFQACEGLGVCHYHLNQHSTAVESFNNALQLLDTIKDDTGIARERVMEKLSDVTETLKNSAEEDADHLMAADRSQSALSSQPSSAEDTSRQPLNSSTERTPQPPSETGIGKKRGSNELQTQPTTLQNQDSCDLEIKAYEQTLASNESSSDEENVAVVQQPVLTPQRSLLQGPSASYPQSPVTEGSLSIGQNARDTYTIQRSRVENEGKGRRRRDTTEIVERERKESTSERDEVAMGSVPINDHHLSRDHSHGTTQHSRTCRIL